VQAVDHQIEDYLPAPLACTARSGTCYCKVSLEPQKLRKYAYTLMIEVLDLLPKYKIFQQGRPSVASR
jgi:hypothetical protein